jgi:hypothetical protein
MHSIVTDEQRCQRPKVARPCGVAFRKPLGGQANSTGCCSLPCPPDMAACLTRRLFARSPATRLHRSPRQRLSDCDHGVQMWSNMGLA